MKILGDVRDRHGFVLAGYVVMPNHVHLLISEPAATTGILTTIETAVPRFA